MLFKSVRGYGFFNKFTSFKNITVFGDENLREKAKRIDHSLKG